jgi:hypothetical protein
LAGKWSETGKFCFIQSPLSQTSEVTLAGRWREGSEKMNWSPGAWALLGVAGAEVGRRILDLAKGAGEHWLDRRKEKATEDRAIRAEQREQARLEAERTRAKDEQLQRDDDTLTSLKVEMRAVFDWGTAANAVEGIHDFFDERKQYNKLFGNEAFLVKYPNYMAELIRIAGPEKLNSLHIEELKRDAEALRIR